MKKLFRILIKETGFSIYEIAMFIGLTYLAALYAGIITGSILK